MQQGVEKFTPTSGRFVGVIGLLLSGLVLVSALWDGLHRADIAVFLGVVLAAVVVWAFTLRPRLALEGDDLVMRRSFSTVWIPLVAIETVVIRQVFAVRTPQGRFVSSAAGHPLRRLRKRAGGEFDPANVYADFVEQRVRQRVDDERAKAGLGAGQQAAGAVVRRGWAWPEIGVAGLALVGLVVALAV